MPKLIVSNLDASREFALQDPSGLTGTVIRVGPGADASINMSESLLVAFEPKLKDAADSGMISYRTENSVDTLGDNYRDPVLVVDSTYQSRAMDGTILVMAVPCLVILPNTEPGSGFNLRVIDGTGAASVGSPITLQALPGSGPLNGGSEVLIDQPYGQATVERVSGSWFAAAQTGASSSGFAPPVNPIISTQTNGAQTVTLLSFVLPDESSVHMDLQVTCASTTKNGTFRVSFGAFRRDAGIGLTVGPVAHLVPPLSDDAGLIVDVLPIAPDTFSVTVTGTVAAGIMNWSTQPQYKLTTSP